MSSPCAFIHFENSFFHFIFRNDLLHLAANACSCLDLIIWYYQSSFLLICATYARSRVARWYVFETKIQIWVNLVGWAMEDAGLIYGRLVCLTTLWYICGRLVYFMLIWYVIFRLGILYQEKSGNPGKVKCRLAKSSSSSSLKRTIAWYRVRRSPRDRVSKSSSESARE
jgi:hypothetical protein